MKLVENSKVRSSYLAFAIVLLLVVAQACSSKKDSPPIDQDAQGLFTTNGSVTANFINPTVVETLGDIKGMIYGSLPNQKFMFFDVTSNVLYDGVITAIALTAVSGTATVYHDGVMVNANVAVTGSVTSRSTISLTFAASGDFDGGSIKGLFILPTSIYDQAATNDRIFADGALSNPLWTGPVIMDIVGMNTTNFDVDATNAYTSVSIKTGARCDHSGTATPASSKNIYTVTETVTIKTGCTLDILSNYNGLLSVVDVMENTMWYAVTNGVNSVFAILTK